jgi:TolB protein
MDADGSNVTQITDNSANDGFPGWSPDGTHIVFQSDRIGDGQFFVANFSNYEQEPLADHRVDGETISWTSD